MCPARPKMSPAQPMKDEGTARRSSPLASHPKVSARLRNATRIADASLVIICFASLSME